MVESGFSKDFPEGSSEGSVGLSDAMIAAELGRIDPADRELAAFLRAILREHFAGRHFASLSYHWKELAYVQAVREIIAFLDSYEGFA